MYSGSSKYLDKMFSLIYWIDRVSAACRASEKVRLRNPNIIKVKIYNRKDNIKNTPVSFVMKQSG